jgi:hypothetical protein
MNKILNRDRAIKAIEKDLYNYERLSNHLKNDPGLLIWALIQINTLEDYSNELQMLKKNAGKSLQNYLKILIGKSDSHISEVLEVSKLIDTINKPDLTFMKPFRAAHICIPSMNIDVLHPMGKEKNFKKEQL